MGYWSALLFLHCFYSSISALPTEIEKKIEDVAVGETRSSAVQEPERGVVAQEIAVRIQDPTENLVCRVVKMMVPRSLFIVPATLEPKYSGTTARVQLREYLYSPAVYTTLCVSPEKPKPFPLFFAPPPPLALQPVAGLEPPVSKGPVGVSTGTSRPSSAMSAPPPAISLEFSSPVGSIGIGSDSSSAVNIGTQSLTDNTKQATWLIRRIVLPYT